MEFLCRHANPTTDCIVLTFLLMLRVTTFARCVATSFVDWGLGDLYNERYRVSRWSMTKGGNTDWDHGRLKIKKRLLYRCDSWMTRNELVGYLFSSGKLDPFLYLFQELVVCCLLCLMEAFAKAPDFFLVLKWWRIWRGAIILYIFGPNQSSWSWSPPFIQPASPPQPDLRLGVLKVEKYNNTSS